MANPNNQEAQRLILQLKGQGMSNADIARLVHRDSSLISQIARKGNKGASLVPALKEYTERGKLSPANLPDRRKTKAGQEAKVRKSTKVVTTKKGVEQTVTTVRKGKATLTNAVKGGAKSGARARWNVKGKVKTKSDKKGHEGYVTGHLPPGWSMQDLENRIASPQAGDNWQAGDVNGALTAIALEQNSSQVTSISNISNYDLYTY